MGKKLYVGNLSYRVSSSDLEQIFSQYGSVESAEVISDRDTGRSKGFGFVEMSSDAEARSAIDALHDQEHDGRRLTVNEARPREPRSPGGGGGGVAWRWRTVVVAAEAVRWRRRTVAVADDPAATTPVAIDRRPMIGAIRRYGRSHPNHPEPNSPWVPQGVHGELHFIVAEPRRRGQARDSRSLTLRSCSWRRPGA